MNNIPAQITGMYSYDLDRRNVDLTGRIPVGVEQYLPGSNLDRSRSLPEMEYGPSRRLATVNLEYNNGFLERNYYRGVYVYYSHYVPLFT